MEELVREFIVETGESVSIIYVELVALEKDPSNLEVLESIFRKIHTIRCASIFLALPNLENISHSVEEMLGQTRTCDVEITLTSISVVRDMVHEINALVNDLASYGEESNAPGEIPDTLAPQTQSAKRSAKPMETVSTQLPHWKSDLESEISVNKRQASDFDASAIDQIRVLLVDDSPFFCGVMISKMTSAGYAVTAAEDADTALELRERGEDFDIIICDFEIQGMTGFELAKAIREGGSWTNIAMIALLSHITESEVEKCRVSGFDDWVNKYECDLLIDNLSELVRIKSTAS